MRRILGTMLAILVSYGAIAQILTESNLPIIVINTDGGDEIPDEPKINGTMGIINNGDGMTNSLSDPFNYHFGNIGIETRGNSTQDFEKKTYSLELRNEANQDTSINLFNMGKEEDWILHAMVIDKTQIRIPFSFYVFQQMGHYASDWQYVELVINGDYRGLYLFCERIKRDDDRVDIAKLSEDEITGDDVTGGYILRIDWTYDYEGAGFESQFESQSGDNMIYQWYYPREEAIQPEQAQYIENWMYRFESAAFSNDYMNDQGERYTDLINVSSFTDFLLINELSKNADGYKLSSYIHKDKDSNGGKLVAGPIWDFDQSYGSSLVCSTHIPEGWTYLQEQDGCEDLESMPMWWQRMMQDSIFTNHLACRWSQFRQDFLSLDAINNWIVEDTTLISQALTRNYMRWDDVIGEYIWIEPDPLPETYQEEVEVMQNWISQRVAWLDANMPGNCEFDVITNVESPEILQASVYPNPAGYVVNVRTNEAVQINLIDAQGRVIYQSQLPQSQFIIDVSAFAKGTYILRLEGDNSVGVERLVVQ
ncbi:CotH kinase family protein [Sanyastnella coralliicola]|uniref:CotH kinase family protein n=1 Tax=Sanyastnella coralliicola TaxID=3069118 RepID=UPI0027BA4DB6|nr:CotH kinase family protein [Longitalea sp. SCSIO 12813]